MGCWGGFGPSDLLDSWVVLSISSGHTWMRKSLKALAPVCVCPRCPADCRNVVEDRVLPQGIWQMSIFFTAQVGWVEFRVCELHWLGRFLENITSYIRYIHIYCVYIFVPSEVGRFFFLLSEVGYFVVLFKYAVWLIFSWGFFSVKRLLRKSGKRA